MPDDHVFDEANLVFVYGTLKSGEPNHQTLTDQQNGSSKFISEATTVEKFPLVIASKYNIPFLLDVPGTGKEIIGEVYSVDKQMMLRLDELEEHPHLYIRQQRPICVGDEVQQVWIYLLKSYKPHLLNEPFVQNYNSDYANRVGKPYLVRYLRDPEHKHRDEVFDNAKTLLS